MKQCHAAIGKSAKIMVAGVVMLACACTDKHAVSAPPAIKEHHLRITAVQSGVPLAYVATGSLIADERIDVASRLSGYLKTLYVREGDAVKRGQPLAQIDAPDVEAAITQARAALQTAEAAARDAEVDLENVKQLHAKQIIPENDLRKAQLRKEAAQDAFNQAKASLDASLAQRRYAEIISPLDGTVVNVMNHSGDLIMPGIPMMHLESDRRLVFETRVTAEQLPLLRVDQHVNLTIDKIGVLPGRISRIIQSADPVTRSYPVQVKPESSDALMAGMFGKAEFALGTQATPVVPVEFLTERAGLKGVFVVEPDNTLAFRWLRTGREWPDKIEVLAGLNEGEYIAEANTAVRDGDHLEIGVADR